MPEIVGTVTLPWGTAEPVAHVAALPWGVAAPVQTLGTPFTPPAAPPGGTETSGGGVQAETAIDAATRYDATHTMSLVLDSTGAALPVDSVRLSLDDNSVFWTLNGTGGADLFPAFSDGAVVPTVTLTIDGLVWRFLVETVNRPRAFASERISFTGRSLAASAAAPYELQRNWIGDAPTTAAQISDGAQQATGLQIDWLVDDWLVPEGVLSYTGTPLGVVQHVAQAIRADVTAHRSEYRITVAPRYPLLPDQWLCVAPDVQVAFEAVETESYDRADQPTYDAVVVAGQQQGAFGVVTLAGTAGNRQAPLVTDVLLTDEPAIRQRGQAVLGASGPQARVTRTLPVLTGTGQPGVLQRGQLVRWVDPDEVWAGVVRSVSVQASLPVVTQTVTVERHTATVAGPPDPAPIAFVGPVPDLSAPVGEVANIDIGQYWEGGAIPRSFSMRSGVLPQGLSLTDVPGRVTGTPTLPQTVPAMRLRGKDGIDNTADSNEFTFTVGINGPVWTEGSVSPTDASFGGSVVGYGAEVFVAADSGGTNNAFYRSVDGGASWQKVTTALPLLEYNRVIYGDGAFLAVCSSASTSRAISRSTDLGQTWTANTTALPSVGYWYGIAYGGGVFLAVRWSSTQGAKSTDGGVTWTSITLPASRNWQRVLYLDGRWIITARNSSEVYYSDNDGATWALLSTVPTAAATLTLAAGGGKVFLSLLATTNIFFVSSNGGASWTEVTLPKSCPSPWVYFSEALNYWFFLARPATGQSELLASADGVNWAVASNLLPVGVNAEGIAYGDGTIVAVNFSTGACAYARFPGGAFS
jgi:hypothetical protein